MIKTEKTNVFDARPASPTFKQVFEIPTEKFQKMIRDAALAGTVLPPEVVWQIVAERDVDHDDTMFDEGPLDERAKEFK